MVAPIHHRRYGETPGKRGRGHIGRWCRVIGHWIYLFDGRRKGGCRDSLACLERAALGAMPAVYQPGEGFRLYSWLGRCLQVNPAFCAHGLGDWHFIVMLCATNKPMGE